MDRIVTLKDIAKMMGVSVTTVSKALRNHSDISEKTKNEILKMVEELHYVPNETAKSLRSKKTNFIGLVVGDNTNPYFAKVIKNLERQLSAAGYYTLIFNNNEDIKTEINFIQEMRSLNVAGVILSPARGNLESTKLLNKFGIPYVMMNRYLQKGIDNYVVANDEKAGYLATNHLVERYSDRTIIMLNYLPTVSTAMERRKGFERALLEKNIEITENNIISGCMNQYDGYMAMNRVLHNCTLPLAVVCYSDYIAMGCMGAVYKKNLRIPEDVSIIGIDNIEDLSFLRPGISTVDIPKSAIAKNCVDILLKKINAKTEIADRQVVLEPNLIIRQTT